MFIVINVSGDWRYLCLVECLTICDSLITATITYHAISTCVCDAIQRNPIQPLNTFSYSEYLLSYAVDIAYHILHFF